MNVSPFLVAILACLWLKERITAVEVVCMLGAFGGILLVGLTKHEDDGGSAAVAASEYNIGLFCALVSALGYSVTLVTTRKLKALSVYVI